MRAIPPVRSRRGPRRRHPAEPRADKAYHSRADLAFCRSPGIVPRIARPGIESGERLGGHRWKVEGTISHLDGYRRLTLRYERHGTNVLGFLALGAALTCWKKLTHTTI